MSKTNLNQREKQVRADVLAHLREKVNQMMRFNPFGMNQMQLVNDGEWVRLRDVTKMLDDANKERK